MGQKGPQQVGSHEHPDFQRGVDKPCSPQQPFQKLHPNFLEAAGQNLQTPGGRRAGMSDHSWTSNRFLVVLVTSSKSDWLKLNAFFFSIV